MSCPTLITPSCPAPTGHLFPCCMYRITALRCVPTVHTVWVWCVEYGADGCFVLAKTEIAVFGLRQHHQHVAGKDFAVFLPEHVLQHLPGQENAIILTGHVLGPLARRQRQAFSGSPHGSRKMAVHSSPSSYSRGCGALLPYTQGPARRVLRAGSRVTETCAPSIR